MEKIFRSLSRSSYQLYREQVTSGVAVYPADYSLEKIRKLQDPGSRYNCVVEESGKVHLVGYNHAYRDTLQLASLALGKLLEAPGSNSLYPTGYIRSVLKACRDNTWADAEDEWLKAYSKKSYPYVVYFGPAESISDKALGLKRFFSFTIMKVNLEAQKAYRTWLKHLPEFFEKLPLKGSLPPDRVTLLTGEVLAWGGELRKLYAVGWSRPEDVNLLEQFGSVKQIFENLILQKSEQLYWPSAQSLLPKSLWGDFEQYLKNEYVYSVVLHELSHTLGKFPGYRDKLGSLYNRFEEVRAESLAHLLAEFFEKRKVLPEGFSGRMALGELVIGTHMVWVYRQTGLRQAYADIQCCLVNSFGTNLKIDNGRVSFGSVKEASKSIRDLSVKMLKVAKSGNPADFLRLAKPSGKTEQMYLQIKKYNLPTEPTASNMLALAHKLKFNGLKLVNGRSV